MLLNRVVSVNQSAFCGCLYLAMLFNPLSAKAIEDELIDLFSMPIEELMNVKITTAAKFEQTIHDAHASISIITKQQIAQFGGMYLADILERIVNVNHSYGALSSITTRGSQPWSSLAHHLALINGRPFGNLTGGHSLYTSFPLAAIERIEYIRGPGSVLYGTNAYHGVFNVITKRAKADGWHGQQKLTLGSFETELLDGSYQYRQGDFNGSLNLLYADSDGWLATMFDPIEQRNYSRKAFQQERTLHIDAQYQHFSFSHYYSNQQRFANFWDAPEANYIPWSKVHPVNVTNLSFDYRLNAFWRVESHATHYRKTLQWSSDGIADDLVQLTFPLEANLFELNLFGQLADDINFLAGLTREDRRVKNSFTIPDTNEDYASIYFQVQQQFTSTLSYMLGGQYVSSINLQDDDNNKSHFVPRLGIIYDVDEHLAVKLLYGGAYRQPQAGERFISSPGIQKGTPDLDAELSSTLELQLFYQDSSQFMTLTYYHNEEKNLIQVAPSDDPLFALENKNQGSRQSNGIELEYKYQPNQQWQLEFAWAKQQNKNEMGVRQATLMPDSSWKLGIGYHFKHWQLGLYNIHYAHFQNTKLLDPTSQAINPPAQGFNWLTLKASTELFKFNHSRSLELSLELKNILDEKVYFPYDTPVFYPSNTLPGREGFSVYINLTYRL